MKKYNYICIEGNIGAGKTSLTQLLSNKWADYPIYEEFTDNPFLPQFYKDPERYGFQVELFFMTERHKQLEKIRPVQNLFEQSYIADYFFQKTMIFAGHTLVSDEYKLFLKLFDILKLHAPTPDLLVYLHRPISTITKLITGRDRSMEKQIDVEYLQKVQDAYFEYFRGITHFPILILDIGDSDFIKDSNHLDAISEHINKDYLPGVHHISL